MSPPRVVSLPWIVSRAWLSSLPSRRLLSCPPVPLGLLGLLGLPRLLGLLRLPRLLRLLRPRGPPTGPLPLIPTKGINRVRVGM